MSGRENIVHLWTGLVSDWMAELDRDFLNGVLSKEEQAQADRFAFEADRQVYRLAHGMLRHLLSHYQKGSPADWEFVSGPHGRPELQGESYLRFNLSHTRGAAAVAIAERVDVGVDIEALDRSISSLETVARSWSAREQADLNKVAAASRRNYFLRVWTLKEAYIKARGLGLALPLDQFSLSIAAPGEIEFVADAGESNADWRFWQSLELPEYVMGLAWRGDARVVVHSFTPGCLTSREGE